MFKKEMCKEKQLTREYIYIYIEEKKEAYYSINQ